MANLYWLVNPSLIPKPNVVLYEGIRRQTFDLFYFFSIWCRLHFYDFIFDDGDYYLHFATQKLRNLRILFIEINIFLLHRREECSREDSGILKNFSPFQLKILEKMQHSIMQHSKKFQKFWVIIEHFLKRSKIFAPKINIQHLIVMN